MKTPPSTSDSSDAAACHAVFVDTSLDTHLAMFVCDTDTVSDLKKRIQQEHPLCFPDVREIKIVALKVKRKGKFYYLSDSMFVKSAFREVCDSWFLSADASNAKEDSENHNPIVPDSGNLIAFRSTDANTSADVVDLLPGGPSKRSSNLEDTFLLQDENNRFMKHNPVVWQSDFRDSSKGIAENLQIGIGNTADNNPRVLSHASRNDSGKNDEGQRDFVNLNSLEFFSNPREPVKAKRKWERENAVEKSLGENIMASNFVKESSRGEIISSREGEKGKNVEYLDAIVDHISAGEILQSGPTAKRLRETVVEGGENSLAENVNSDSVKDGTRLEVRRSSNNVEGGNVCYQNGFISTRSKVMENPNVESLRITETVGRHLDGEANTALPSGSISAGPSFSEQYIASPEKRQELGKKNNVINNMDYDVDQADDHDMARQNEEPELGLSSENLGSTQVDQHPGKPGHPPVDVQQTTDLGDGVKHSNRTATPGDGTVEPKKTSKKTNQSSKTHDQVRPQAYGRGNNSRGLRKKQDPPYISEHPLDVKEDGRHEDRSGKVEGEVEEPKITTKKMKKYKKSQDPVEAETASVIEDSEGTAKFISPSMAPQSKGGDHLSNITSKEGQAFESQQSSDLKKDGNSLHHIETDRPESEVVERKSSVKKKRKSKKTEDQYGAEIASGMEYSGGPPQNISSTEVPASLRGDGFTDLNTKEDPSSLFQWHDNLQEDEVSEHHNGSVTFEAEVLEPKTKSKKRRDSKKTLDQVAAETASGMEHSGRLTNDVSSAKVPKFVKGDDLNDSSPKGNPPFLSQPPNNLLEDVVSKYDDRSATLETTDVEPKSKSKKRKKCKQTQVEVGAEATALIELSGCPRNDISLAEVPMTASADDLTDVAPGDDPPFSSQQPDNLRYDGVSQFGNGSSATLDANYVKPKKSKKDRKKSMKTQDQAGIEISSITEHSGGLTNDISVSEVAESVYLGDVTGKLDVLPASHLPNNPPVAAVSLNDNKTGTPEAEVGNPTKSSKRMKKTKKIQDRAGEEMSLGTGHSGDPTNHISQVLTSVSDHLIDVATDKEVDNTIQNVLDSLQSENDENAEDMDRKPSKKSKKQKSPIMVDSLTKISDDASHKDHRVSADDVDKVKTPLKSTKSEKLNSSSINQLSTSNLEAEDGREIKIMPKHGMLVTGSPSTLLLTYEGIPLEASFEKDSPNDNVDGLGKCETVKKQNRSDIVAGGDVSNGKQTDSKDAIEKVEAKKIKKKLDQPSSERGSVFSPKLDENQDCGVEAHVKVPVNEAKSAQSNKLKFTSEDAQRLNSTVKSSHLKGKTEGLASFTNANRKSDTLKPKVTVRNASHKNDAEVLNISKPKRSLFGSGLFKDSIEESSDDEDETNNSYTSTRTPSNDSALLDYRSDDTDSDADSRETDSGRSVTAARSVTLKDKSLQEIVMCSSRYKKAKLVALQSQLDDDDGEEVVPHSQPIF